MISSERKYIDCGSGIRRYDTSTVMDGLVVFYKITGAAEISASRSGVLINSVMVHTEGRKRFETVLEWAFKQHDHFREFRDAIPQEELGRIED